MSTERSADGSTGGTVRTGPGRFFADLLTIGNAACGLIAIYFALLAYYLAAGGFLLLAMLFDALDGAAARRFGSWHSKGHLVDTAADMVTMAAAPAVLVWSAVSDLAGKSSLIAFAPAIVYAVCASARLVNYARAGHKQDKFSGLPSPGGLIMVLLLVFLFGPTPFIAAQPALLAALVIVISPLMLAPVSYPKVQGRWVLPAAAIGLLAGVPAIVTYLSSYSYDSVFVKAGALVALAYFLGYALSGPAGAITSVLRRRVPT